MGAPQEDPLAPISPARAPALAAVASVFVARNARPPTCLHRPTATSHRQPWRRKRALWPPAVVQATSGVILPAALAGVLPVASASVLCMVSAAILPSVKAAILPAASATALLVETAVLPAAFAPARPVASRPLPCLRL
jgi:hypothetical protein